MATRSARRPAPPPPAAPPAESPPSAVERRDAIRVVPLALPGSTTRTRGATQPRLTYRGGPLLTACDVVSLFWGAAWTAGAARTVRTGLDAFFPAVLTSSLIDQLSEYNVPAYSIGHGTYSGSFVIQTPKPARSVSDTKIRHFLTSQIAAHGSIPAPNANRLYFIYLPPGTAVVQGGGRSCQVFCGYHDAIADATVGEIFYAVMPYPGCNGCLGGLSPIDALTSTSSHELCEAITDAVPGQGWYDDVHGEIGDICAWKTRRIGTYLVQKEWSNSAGACV